MKGIAATQIAPHAWRWGSIVHANRVLFSLALAILATGCSTLRSEGEPPRAAGVTIPADWATAQANAPMAPAQYWRALGDPLLDRFVAQAIAENRELDRAAARIAQARAGVRAARANFLPRIAGTAGVQRDIGDFADSDPQVSLGGDAQWEIDLFGRIGSDVAASRADLAAAGFGLADLQRLIAGQVALTTVSARAFATQLAIARDTLRIQDDNLQIAQWRLQAGLVSSLDVEQARAQRAQTAALIPALERDLTQAGNTISTLIGEPPGAVRQALASTAAPIPVPPTATGFEAPAAVLRQRPDVRQAEAALTASLARIDVARAQLLPLVQLTGNIGTASRGLGGLFDIVTGGLLAGVNQLIFDGGRTRAQIDGARAIAADALAAWEQAILTALADVEDADAALIAGRDRTVLFNTALEAADNAALLARSQYRAGLIDFQTLLTAENQLLSARNALAASEAERASAFVALAQALGGGWDGTNPADMTDTTDRNATR